MTERFEEQLSTWINTSLGGDEPEPICPSDLANFVLSEGLRAACAHQPGSRSVNAAVVYKDGSRARGLPLRALPISEVMPDAKLELRLTLLSVRHMEMDATVDGAWLRNREISQNRPAAQTDELVYRQSRDQLAMLSADGPLNIHLFQTGLETAIVGFYRALVDHHLEGTGQQVAVQPWYYEGGTRFAPGTAWVMSQ